MRDARVRALSRAKLVVAESALISKWLAEKQISLAPFAEKIHYRGIVVAPFLHATHAVYRDAPCL